MADIAVLLERWCRRFRRDLTVHARVVAWRQPADPISAGTGDRRSAPDIVLQTDERTSLVVLESNGGTAAPAVEQGAARLGRAARRRVHRTGRGRAPQRQRGRPG